MALEIAGGILLAVLALFVLGFFLNFVVMEPKLLWLPVTVGMLIFIWIVLFRGR